MRRKVTPVGAQPGAGGIGAAPFLGFGVGIAAPSADGEGGATVAQIMRHDVRGVEASMSGEALADFLLERRLPGLPVVDRTGRLAGLVTLAELVRERLELGDTEEVPLRAHARGYSYELGGGFHDDRAGQRTVSDLMRLDVTAVLPSTPLSLAATLLADERVEILPVIAPSGQVVGVLLALDLLRWLSRPVGPRPADSARSTPPLT